MEEFRIDVTRQTPEELALANEQAQLIFKFNHTMPGTADYDKLMHSIFTHIGEGSRVSALLTAVRPLPDCAMHNDYDDPVQLGLDSCGD